MPQRGCWPACDNVSPVRPDPMDFLITTLLNALTLISILMLVGLGLAISFGLMNVTNLAHGEFVTVGAFAVYFVQSMGGSFWLGLAAAPIAGAVIGCILEFAIILPSLFQAGRHRPRNLGRQPDPAARAGTHFGSRRQAGDAADRGHRSTSLHRLSGLSADPDRHRHADPASGVILLISRTSFGLDIRTVIQNREMAEGVGINTRRTYAIAFTFGAAIAGLAGGLVAPLAIVLPQMGVTDLANAFFVVIVGGVGSIGGLVAGSVFVGGLTSVLNYQISPSLAQAIVLLAAIVAVRLRPNGLFNGASR